jgi:hypothetical protein
VLDVRRQAATALPPGKDFFTFSRGLDTNFSFSFTKVKVLEQSENEINYGVEILYLLLHETHSYTL